MLSTLRSLAAFWAAGLLFACSDSGSGTAIVDAHTLVAVDPVDFPSTALDARGVSLCSGPDSQGAYVAELIDVSGVETDLETVSFPVQSSPPTACSRAVAFARIVEHREYVARVWTYADSDGDPNTIDICTKGGTSVAVTRVSGECTTTPAVPVSQLKCYGWQKPSESQQHVAPVPDAAESATAAGAPAQPADSATAGGASALTSESSLSCGDKGCPGVAIAYRTITLHYCVADSDR